MKVELVFFIEIFFLCRFMQFNWTLPCACTAVNVSGCAGVYIQRISFELHQTFFCCLVFFFIRWAREALLNEVRQWLLLLLLCCCRRWFVVTIFQLLLVVRYHFVKFTLVCLLYFLFCFFHEAKKKMYCEMKSKVTTSHAFHFLRHFYRRFNLKFEKREKDKIHMVWVDGRTYKYLQKNDYGKRSPN